MTSERDRVADELTAYLRSVGLNDPWSDDATSSTRWRYAPDGELYSADRLEFHGRLIDAELARRSKISRRSSLGVVVTAGPPGAGKSTALAADASVARFRDVDADAFKDALLLEEHATGALQDHLGHELADGRTVAVRELSAYVHAESTTIASAMRDRCLVDGENIVVHGTLASIGHTEELLQQLDQYGYSRLVIFDVEVTVERAIEQALDRWWSARLDDSDDLGGRFVSPETIRQQYPPGADESICAANASTLRERAEQLGWTVELRRL